MREKSTNIFFIHNCPFFKIVLKKITKFSIIKVERMRLAMEKILTLARYFYGVFIPEKFQKNFFTKVLKYLNDRYSIETAIGLAIKELKLH